jgi:quercetin dioxygenase-like cupin family protein
MKPVKSFPLFVETVHIMVNKEMSGGASTVLVTEVPPGGGPPPHTHTMEDEIFTALEGEFELLIEGEWVAAPVGVPMFGPRGGCHTFRNAGSTVGKLQIVAAPGGLEVFLEHLSKLSPATQMTEMMELAARYGITFNLPGSA